MPQTKPVISVENVVASASVDQKIDLIEVTKKHPKTEYHPCSMHWRENQSWHHTEQIQIL